MSEIYDWYRKMTEDMVSWCKRPLIYQNYYSWCDVISNTFDSRTARHGLEFHQGQTEFFLTSYRIYFSDISDNSIIKKLLNFLINSTVLEGKIAMFKLLSNTSDKSRIHIFTYTMQFLFDAANLASSILVPSCMVWHIYDVTSMSYMCDVTR